MCPRVKAMARELDYRSNVTPTPEFGHEQVPCLRWQFIRSLKLAKPAISLIEDGPDPTNLVQCGSMSDMGIFQQ